MQKNLERIEAAGIQLVGISYDDPETLKSFATENQVTFPLLSDHISETENQTIHDYKVFDPREKGKYRGVPIPTTFVVDQEKKIRLILDGSTKKRHSVDDLIGPVERL